MTVLLTTDWHLTSHPRDRHRWDLFPWLRKQITKTGAKQLIVCGDITDAKDRHSSDLVNRLTGEIAQLVDMMVDIIFIRGNHDGLAEGSAFFAFMQFLGRKRVFYVLEPTVFEIDDGTAGARNRKESLFLPCTKSPEDWRKLDLKGIRYIFCHQTFSGALAENGVELRGISPDVFSEFKGKVFSGDVHVPQRVGKNIEYIGCPYRVHFGDTFTPRVLLLRKGETVDLHPNLPSREAITIRTLNDLTKTKFEPDTQVKVRIKLKRSEYPEWPEMRRQVGKLCQDHGWELCGVELSQLKGADRQREDDETVAEKVVPEDIVRKHADAKRLNKSMTTLGLDLLKEAQE